MKHNQVHRALFRKEGQGKEREKRKEKERKLQQPQRLRIIESVQPPRLRKKETVQPPQLTQIHVHVFATCLASSGSPDFSCTSYHY